MRLPHLPSLSLLLLALTTAHAQPLLPADEFFHNGAQSYLSNNIPLALETVTNGRALYPDDIKLKKLEELLKQQQQQQQQQQNQDKQNQQDKQDQQNQQQQSKSEQDKQKSGGQQEAKATPAGEMTPQQAARLLDAQKGDEEALVFKPEGKPKDTTKPLKDW